MGQVSGGSGREEVVGGYNQRRTTTALFIVLHLPSQRHYFALMAGGNELFVQLALLILVAALDDELEESGDRDFTQGA
ncbi:MAG: hypothetical protein IT427_13180 [Pirellulales bacterium]|nr:hypothetical protein [Pirellulales bacterium]